MWQRSLLGTVAAAALVSAMPARAAGLDDQVTFNIPSQSLDTALLLYSRQSGVQVVAPSDVLFNRQAPAIQATATPRRALTLLLQGSNLTFTAESGATVSISPKMAQATMRTLISAEQEVTAVRGSSVAAAAAVAETTVSDLVVTGSRLPSGFDTPTPVSVVSVDQLMAASPNNMSEALNQIPSLQGSVQNTTSGQGSANSQTNGQSLLNLRRLGSNRTLVLLDGQRMGVTNVVGSVDVNIIPQSLVKRVEVVTGGASASYGSDAVAGVVNFILDTTYEGMKAEVSGGETGLKDSRNGKVTFAFGRKLGDRGRVIGGLEYVKQDGIQYGETTGRDWFDHPTMSVANAAGASPRWLLIPNAQSRLGTYGGTITATSGCSTPACTALLNQRFLPGGALTPHVFGANAFGNNPYVTGGDGAIANQPFSPDSERKGLFLHGEFDIAPDMTLWAEGSYNTSSTFLQAQVLQVQTTSQFRIYEDNAFLPAAISTVLLADPGVDSFSLTRYNKDMGYNEVTGNVKVARYAAGLKGRLGDRWSYDVNLGYQDSHQDLDVRTAISRNLYAAAEAVRRPDTGAIVCRSQYYTAATAAAPNGVFVPGGVRTADGKLVDEGCVPLNLFGDGAASAEATKFVMGLNTADVNFSQSTADLNLRGDFGDNISLGAGPISFATGVNYRRLTANRVVDPLSPIIKDGTGIRSYPTALQGSIGGYSYYNPAPLKGRVSVTEAYGEIGLPLLKDKPLFQSLAATLAGRVTDYSQSGVVKTWKAGLNWTVDDNIRIRGTVSSDIRAPTVTELFSTAQVSRGTYTLPSSFATATFVGSGQNINNGNPALTPEEAKTYVFGVVFSPTFVPRLRASIDYYKIELLGAIAAPGNQRIIDDCARGDQAFCSLIKVNGVKVTGTSAITVNDFVEVTNPLLNEPRNQNVSGLDLEASYTFPVLDRDLTLRFSETYLLTSYDPSSACAIGALGKTTDFVGAIGNCGQNPKIRARGSADYDVGPFGFHVQERYIDKGLRNPNFKNGVDINDNDVPRVWYTDATITYDLGERFSRKGELYFNVQNLFDQDPPPTNSTAGRSWIDPTEPELYDLLGRRFVVGVRLSW